DHAVARRDAATAYDVVTPAMRRGTTRAQWAAGNVPVYPYPAARQRVQIAWVWASYRNQVDFDVVLLPRKGARVGPMSAGVDMKATGTGALRRWRVDERILVLDGACGTMRQHHGLAPEAYAGARFRDHPRDVAGAPDLLNLPRPDIVLAVHRAYLEAGADITTTNTFTATSIGQAD